MNQVVPGTGLAKAWAALPFLLAGASLPVIDVFLISMILPTIRMSLGASAMQTQLVASAFNGVYAVFLITGSRLGDLFGRRRLFQIGIGGFVLASLLCALAPSIGWLIAGRALQGLSGALFAPQVLATIGSLFSPGDRARAIGFMGTAFSLAGVVGLLMGGLIIAWQPFGLSWQIVFAAYIPLALVIAAGSLLVPETKNPHAQGLDPIGVLLLFVALGLLIFPLTEGRASGWPLWSFVLLAIAPLVWIGFTWYESRYQRRGGFPLVSMELFREGPFIRGLLLAFLLYLAYGFLFCFALFLKASQHLSALELGLVNLPFALAFLLISFWVGPLTARLKSRILVLGFGLLTLGWSGLMFSVLFGAGGTDFWGIAGLAVAGLGNGLVLPSLIRVVTSALAVQHAGLASGVLLSVQQMGSALGVVILGGVYFSGMADSGDPVGAFAQVLALAIGLGVAAAGVAVFLRQKPAVLAATAVAVSVESKLGD